MGNSPGKYSCRGCLDLALWVCVCRLRSSINCSRNRKEYPGRKGGIQGPDGSGGPNVRFISRTSSKKVSSGQQRILNGWFRGVGDQETENGEGRPSGSPHRCNFEMSTQGTELAEGGDIHSAMRWHRLYQRARESRDSRLGIRCR